MLKVFQQSFFITLCYTSQARFTHKLILNLHGMTFGYVLKAFCKKSTTHILHKTEKITMLIFLFHCNRTYVMFSLATFILGRAVGLSNSYSFKSLITYEIGCFNPP